ncbi:MAG: iron export ABC transporter permease subunit FetB [Nitrospiraceae bacterium]|nr:iron export ABC transporter permease subunit FetB [Nitrospiraceae bacterium]
MNSAGGALQLSSFDVGVAALLILVAGGVSFALRLGLERRLGLAAVRTVVQLLLVGFVLRWVFGVQGGLAVGGIAILMVVFASRAAVQRPKRTFRGAAFRSFGSLILSSFTTTLIVTAVIVRVEPWYAPQYVIPLLGMVLGNGLTGLSLSLDHLLESFSERRGEIEMELALGATRWEAARDPVADAVRRGMIPIINSMMVVGIVSLPGMMTGQILQGADPLDAVKYQIVVMFMIAGATAMSSIMMALLVFRRMFTARHQLRSDLIRERSN